MERCSLIAPAKINLHLEIIGDRPDGFHELAMVMQSIDLVDRIDLHSISTDTIRVRCAHPDVPNDRTNLAYQAARLMAERFPETFANLGGVEIHIEKNIPIAAGLAGGSSNAAAVLVGLNLLWKLGLTQSELQELSASIGSDIPFCISGGTALATGRGETISPLPGMDGLHVVLGKFRNLAVSTPWAYKTFREHYSHTYITDEVEREERRQNVHAGPMVSAISHRDGRKIGELLYNDLEKVVLPEFPQVAKLREAMSRPGILGAMMSGSGPTVFALTETAEQAQQVRDGVKAAMADEDLDLWVAQFFSTGISTVEGV